MAATKQTGPVGVHAKDCANKLLRLIGKIDRPMTVCSFGDRSLILPGLNVEDTGSIGLPLGETQARQLIDLCEQAPYGKGTDTVVDTKVRRVWQLGPENFVLTNSKWPAFVDSLLADVQSEFGLASNELKAHLYKLLVYERGSFFLPHSDGEKLDGMVATLVIALPSLHEGGELLVTHDGQTTTIPMTGAASGFEISFAAFYADCRHEVRPVTNGHRLCLVYNVTLVKSKKKVPRSPEFSRVTTNIAATLGNWASAQPLSSAADTDKPESRKLALTLDHEYTEDGLKFDQLKGTDRAIAEVLFNAAQQANCVAHLGLVTLYQQGMAEGGYDAYSHYGSRRSSRYGRDHNDSDSEYEMGEVYEDSLSVERWSDREGNSVSLGEMFFREDEVICETPLSEWDPSQEEFEGYTGNAGMTLERWYRRAAIVIWPQAENFDVLCDSGTDASIAGLQTMVAGLKSASKRERDSLRQSCVRFAGAIIRRWNPNSTNWSMAHGRVEFVEREIFVRLLCELNDAELLKEFVTHVLPTDSRIAVDRSLAAFCNRHGWSDVEEDLAAVLKTVDHNTALRNARILEQICTTRGRNPTRLKACRELCDVFVTALIAFDKSSDISDWQIRQIDRKQILSMLISSMIAVDARDPLKALVTHTLLATDRYDLIADHLAAMFVLKSRLAKIDAPIQGIDDWLKKCHEQLETRTADKPQPPVDFRRDNQFPCDCADCRSVKKFLVNADESSLKLPLAKQRRQHLHNMIDRNSIDLTHVTQRTGRPFTLVLRKTKTSYKKAFEIFERDLQFLADVERIRSARQQRVIPGK
ncbi:MAG: 2OG-Fe(II) oxygenase [Fuerstiella sp.]